MIVKAEKQRLKKLLSDAIPLLCKNGIAFQSAFRVEAMIGITVDDNEVVLVCFKETITSDGTLVAQSYGTDDVGENAVTEPAKNTSVEMQSPTAEQRVKHDRDNESDNVDEFEDSANYNDEFEQYGAGIQVFHSRPFSAAAQKSRTATSTVTSDQINSEEQFNLSSGDNEQYSDDVGQSSDRRSHHQRSGSTSSASQQFQVKEEAIEEEDEEEDCMFIKAEQQDLDMYVAQAATSEMLEEASGFGETMAMQPRLQPVAAASRRRFRPAGYPMSYQRGGSRPVQHMQPRGAWPNAGTVAVPFNPRKRGGSTSLPTTPKAKAVRTLARFPNPDGRSQGYGEMMQDFCDTIIQQSTIDGEQVVCHICSARLSNQTSLRNHIRGTHLALKSVRCNICGESFKWAMQLARHKKKEHSDGTQIHIYN